MLKEGKKELDLLFFYRILADRSAEVDNVQYRRGLTDGCAIPGEM
jgi:hypothetical protein